MSRHSSEFVFCSLGHIAEFGAALWAAVNNLVKRYVPQYVVGTVTEETKDYFATLYWALRKSNDYFATRYCF